MKGDGYVKLPSEYLTHNLHRPETIEMEFTNENNDALLLWQGSKLDYLYIALKKGKIEYVYQTPGKTLKVTGGKYLGVTSKHHLKVTRSNNTAILEIDGESKKSFTEFATNRVMGDIYLGGLPNEIFSIAETVLGGSAKGLSGCINYVILDTSKSRINILEKDITFHNADKQCSA